MFPRTWGGPASCGNAERLGPHQGLRPLATPAPAGAPLSHEEMSPGTGETDYRAGGEAGARGVAHAGAGFRRDPGRCGWSWSPPCCWPSHSSSTQAPRSMRPTNEITGVTVTSLNPGRARDHLGGSQPHPRRLPGHLEEVRRQVALLKEREHRPGRQRLPDGYVPHGVGPRRGDRIQRAGARPLLRRQRQPHGERSLVGPARGADGVGPSRRPRRERVIPTRAVQPTHPPSPRACWPPPCTTASPCFWDNPGDDTITGYQILRGPDAANLAVLTNDTGNASASYTDDTVTAETAYAYAIKARNANGLSPQSDAAPTNTPAAPVEPESELAMFLGRAASVTKRRGLVRPSNGSFRRLIRQQCPEEPIAIVFKPMPQFRVPLPVMCKDDDLPGPRGCPGLPSAPCPPVRPCSARPRSACTRRQAAYEGRGRMPPGKARRSKARPLPRRSGRRRPCGRRDPGPGRPVQQLD